MDGLLTGMILGLTIAAPIGPMGLLCIERTLTEGARNGFAAGLGAATVHMVYAGLTTVGIVRLLPPNSVWPLYGRVAAAGFLLWLGWRLLSRGMGRTVDVAAGPRGAFGSYAAAVALTMSNPVTLSFFLVLTPSVTGEARLQPGWTESLPLPLGVFIGSSLWWLLLSGAVGLVRARVTARTVSRFNQTCGLAIVVMALVIAVMPAT
ncbi:lysine transporter [Azospirillum sp. B21]|uniref:LysE family translocator n=1 Tax=Azospirillum sp. B21 TaxID=2607496 RepID=UPI0011ED4F69|nr:LysE family transporter [Azospirillum sp. B21]KAA0573522.1 lysine transporter [Azospirillum sp. B21]